MKYCKSRFFNAYCLQVGRVGTYRQVLHLTIGVCGSTLYVGLTGIIWNLIQKSMG